MTTEMPKNFIVDCPVCRAKVAAIEHGAVSCNGGTDDDGNEHYGKTVAVGKCPKCYSLLVGESQQVGIGGYDSEYDEWGDFVRVYPNPAKTFISTRIPKYVTDSIVEADKALQVNANIAACVMFGRALEGVCRNLLESTPAVAPQETAPPSQKRGIMLGEGIRRLKEKGLIDERLFDWSQHLHAFRNIAAHPTDIVISREDAEDLQSFVYAIIEYTYDLTDRYDEFQKRLAKKTRK